MGKEEVSSFEHTNFGEMFNTAAKLVEVLLSTVIKHARGARTVVLPNILFELERMLVEKGHG